jgi:hypothetical protein
MNLCLLGRGRLPRALKVATPKPTKHIERTITCLSASNSGIEESNAHGSSSEFRASLRVPSTMSAPLGSSGGGAVMEKAKLSFKQTVKQEGPSIAEAGGGGGIGKKIFNGGDGGGGDDDDDDDYFQEGDGDNEGDDSVWWHKVPLSQLYDAITVKAVLSEWCLTVEQLPMFLQMLSSMQYYSTAQWVRYLAFQERPNLFRAVERVLARFPDARSGFVGRMLADPAFMQKTGMECGIAFVIAMAHEVHVRGKRFKDELEFALINASCIALGAAACSALVAPSKAPTPSSTRFPWEGMLAKLPNNAFEKNTPTRSFEVFQRVTACGAKAVELSAVQAIAGAASAGLQHCVIAARRAQKKSYSPVTPVPGISRAAGGMGVYGGVAANARLQSAAGLERVLLDYAKANTAWQVMGLASMYRLVSQVMLENPWGWGSPVVKMCSRPALQGMPVDHVRTPRRRKVRRKHTRSKQPVQPAVPLVPAISAEPVLVSG